MVPVSATIVEIKPSPGARSVISAMMPVMSSTLRIRLLRIRLLVAIVFELIRLSDDEKTRK
jgi:hypothetical protein